MNTIESRIKKVISEQLGIDVSTIGQQSDLIEDLGADSLDTVELVMAFEEEFGMDIPDEVAEKISTVQDAIDSISSREAA